MKKFLISPEYPNGIYLDYTSEEIAQKQIDDVKSAEYKQDELAKEEQKKARKESAIAKLKALGLTEEEVKSIL
jgi:hypothetical protein